MIVVSDSSLLISLAAIGRLELLRDLYRAISIPRAVYEEVAMQDPGRPGVLEVQTFDWIACGDVLDPSLVIALQARLDRGEAEAIVLAVELQADLLLMDERLGRVETARFGLRFLEILGALIEAKAKGYLLEIKPVLDDLRTNAGFRVSDILYARVLQEAGE